MTTTALSHEKAALPEVRALGNEIKKMIREWE